MNLVIPCGGRGTRLKSVIKKKSKALVKINNKELISYILNQCINIKKKYFLLNKNQNDLVHFLKKKKLQKNIIYEDRFLGDGGCLSSLKKIKNYHLKDFLIISGDLLINTDIKSFIDFHYKKKSELTFWCHPTDHAIDSDLVKFDFKFKLEKFFKKPHKRNDIGNISTAGIYIIKGNLLNHLPKNLKEYSSRNFFNYILKKNINAYCYISRDFIKDAGTKRRLIYLRKLLKRRNNKFFDQTKKLPAIFLDRDGVINKEKKNELFSNPMNIFSGVISALKKINKSKFLSVLITNQPAIAKGHLSFKQLNQMHDKMNFYLSSNGCYFDSIYFCPHHPKKGFKGEITKLKKNCSCRKPKIGMIKDAVKDLNINLKKSVFIGNSLSDYKCSLNAGIKYLHIGKKNFNLIKAKNYKDLFQAVKSLRI